MMAPATQMTMASAVGIPAPTMVTLASTAIMANSPMATLMTLQTWNRKASANAKTPRTMPWPRPEYSNWKKVTISSPSCQVELLERARLAERGDRGFGDDPAGGEHDPAVTQFQRPARAFLDQQDG